MAVSRREFLKYCGASAAALGLTALDLSHLEAVLASPTAPSVIWLQGAGCTGCTESFLNRIATTAPKTAAEVLINSINLVYHPTVMAAAGEQAVLAAQAAYNKGGYILLVEGGVPTAMGGAACFAWTLNGQDVTFQTAVTDLAAKATKVVAIGTCAAYGGIPAAPPNPAGIKSVQAATGKTTLNIPGCAPHPDWITWAVVQLLLGATIQVDTYGRPTTLYGSTVHSRCPRREANEANNFGTDGRCLEEIGCRGPDTRANCPTLKWNNGASWCVESNAPCLGCTEPNFPLSPIWGGEGDD
jgi:hydrogenase small subunit